jgi:hypothetical protein
MDIIVTKGRERRVVPAEGSTIVRDVIAAAGSTGDAYHGDAEAPLDPDAALAVQGVEHGAQILVTTCHRVTASVEFNGETKTHEMPPGAALAALLAWATGPNGFALAADQGPKHALTSCASTEELDKTDHLGSFADDACTACFRLVPSKRFEG